jgi:hypothetical protein
MAYQATKGALRRRPEAQQDTGTVSEGTRAQTLANAVVARNNAEGYAREIEKLWGEAQQKFLAIGRYLCLAKSTLEHGEFERMVASMLPFGRNAAHRLRAVAMAVDEGRLLEETMPRSYTVAYDLVALSDSEFKEAERRSLIRPGLTRREVEDLKRELRQPIGEQRRQILARERARLISEVARMQARIDEIERELGRALTIEICAEEAEASVPQNGSLARE